jgi:hypothetical protein
MASPARVPHIPIHKYANVPAYTPVAKPAPAPAPKAEREREQRQARKIDQANDVLNALNALSARISVRIRELQRRKAAVEARYERIEDRIISEMQDNGYEKCHGVRIEFALRNAPAALKVTDESLIPDDFKRESLIVSVDKTAVKKALVNGAEIDGCELTQKVTLVRK